MSAKSSARTREVRRKSPVASDVDAAAPESTSDPASKPRRATSPNLPDWRWRSFPVFAAFVAGVLVDSLINPASSDPALALRLLAIFGVGYAVVHVAVTNMIVARRIRRYEQEHAAPGAAPSSAKEAPDDEWEDEVVYPGEE